jgi:hypothetical protein
MLFQNRKAKHKHPYCYYLCLASLHLLLLGVTPHLAAADVSIMRLKQTLRSDGNQTFETLIQQAEIVSNQLIEQAFAGDSTITEVSVEIFGERNGQEALMLLSKVSRSNWQRQPMIRQWSKRFSVSQYLLGFVKPPTPPPAATPVPRPVSSPQPQGKGQVTPPGSPQPTGVPTAPGVTPVPGAVRSPGVAAPTGFPGIPGVTPVPGTVRSPGVSVPTGVTPPSNVTPPSGATPVPTAPNQFGNPYRDDDSDFQED